MTYQSAAGASDGAQRAEIDRAEILTSAEVFAIPLVDRFRGITVRDGVMLRGPAGWGEFAPFHDYTDAQCVPWLRSALEAATAGWPAPLRTQIEVNTTVPVVSPERAAALVTASGCRTAKVKIADTPDFAATLAADCDRVAAVRTALGPSGRIRVDANGKYTLAQALIALPQLDAAAGGLEYAEQPCPTVPELAAVRRELAIPIAADESIRLADDPLRVAEAGAADVAVIKVAPLGGVRRALDIAVRSGLQVVVSSAVDTAVGLSAGLALAAALPGSGLACGLGTRSLLVTDVSQTSMLPIDGVLAVRRTAPEPDRISEVRAEADLDAYWRARLVRVAALLG